MIKRIITLILAVSVVALFVAPIAVSGYSFNKHVVDNANLVEASNEDLLAAKLSVLPKSYDYDVVVVTEYSVDDLAEYCEQFMYEHNFKDNTVLLLYAKYENEAYIDVWGGCQAAIGDMEMENLFDALELYIDEQLYYEAFDSFANLCGTYIGGYITTNGSLPDMSENELNIDIEWYHLLLGSAVIGIVVGFISVGVMKSKLRSVKSNNFAGNYIMRDSMFVTKSGEYFLYRNITRTPRPKSNSSGGRSGGISHRGGGRRF